MNGFQVFIVAYVLSMLLTIGFFARVNYIRTKKEKMAEKDELFRRNVNKKVIEKRGRYRIMRKNLNLQLNK